MISILHCPRLSGALAFAGLLAVGETHAAPLALTESTFTEIIQEAKVIAAVNKAETPGEKNMLFKSPHLVRTGQASRVELTAKDSTITRFGANRVFTFAQGGRDIQPASGLTLGLAPAGFGLARRR